MPSCSIIIPTLNTGNLLAPLISSLRQQSLSPDEIIIIDSSSTDNTPDEAIRLGCKLLTISRSEFNHGGTRNQAALQAKGDVLVFMTQDALPLSNSFLEELVKPIDHGVASATYARQVPYDWARPAEAFARTFNYPPISVIRTKDTITSMGIRAYFFSNVASAVRKDVFLNMGMFPDGIIMNEDMLFCATLIESGHAVMYVAESMIFHSHNYSAAQTFQRYFDIGVFYANNMKKMGEMSIKSTGTNYTKSLFFFLFRKHKFSGIPFFILETCAKFFGFYTGRMELIIPLFLKKRLSLHKGFWQDSKL